MAKYRKKPVIVEAIKFDENKYKENHSDYDEFPVSDRCMLSELWCDKSASDSRYYINTLEGDMTVSNGDYIIKGIQGEFYPCKPDIFEATYEKV